MRTWIKPEIRIEQFVLSQHIAAGCGTKTEIVVTPGGNIKVGVGCASSYPGNGHWHTDITIYDTDGNGKIDWAEFTSQAKFADNGVATGQGHSNHQTTVTLPDGKEIKTTDIPFSS